MSTCKFYMHPYLSRSLLKQSQQVTARLREQRFRDALNIDVSEKLKYAELDIDLDDQFPVTQINQSTGFAEL